MKNRPAKVKKKKREKKKVIGGPGKHYRDHQLDEIFSLAAFFSSCLSSPNLYVDRYFENE